MTARHDTEPHPLCAQLRLLRLAAGLSLNEIQRRHGIPPVVLGSYERGDREPSLRKVDALFGLYGYQLQAVPIGAHAIRMRSDMVTDLRAIATQLDNQRRVEQVA